MKSCGWDEALEKRLRTSRTEAAKEVLTLAKEMYVGDAVALVIESMPARKTAQLRRWNDDWEAWCLWLDWEGQGWKIRDINSGIVGLLAPHDHREGDARPSEEVVAAAIDADAVKFLGLSHFGGRSARHPQMQFLYKIR